MVDKPAGMTSHDVVARVRRAAGTRRVGHGGTLDPMATGVLVVAVGRATRLLSYVSGSDKEYQATIRLGQSTVTDDAEGDVTGGTSTDALTEAQVRTELATLTGAISQVPSAVSAIKVAGRRAYAMVRAGEQVELKARQVRVDRLELHGIFPRPEGLLDLDVTVACSAGTYIRALARDLGATLGVGGHLTALRRTRVGAFTLAEAEALDAVVDRPDPVTLPLPDAVDRFFVRREVDVDDARRICHGNPLPAAGLDGTYAVFGPDGAVLALVRERDGLARPDVVLADAG